MPNKPKKWLAALLGIVAPPIAMMYVAQARWAALYFLATLLAGASSLYYDNDQIVVAFLPIVLALLCAAHAYLYAKRYPDEQQRPAYSRWHGLLGTVAVYFLIVFAVRAFLLEPFRFPSGSMLPTIPTGGFLIVQKWGYGNYGTFGISLVRLPISSSLDRGDLVVFEFPADRSIHFGKRLIGLPGDQITYRAKQLFINGTPVPLRQSTDYLNPKTLTYTSAFTESLMGKEYSVLIEKEAPASILAPQDFPFRNQCTYDAEGVSCTVPEGHYFTMGDNRDNSNDSRMWGFVPADHIIGKVIYIRP
ncbi:MAG TPA: signal peptidase I [Rhodocyclaceae bacterium]|nr:signal peptidase I [Rhodocyclaceae bacterium]